MADQSFRYQPWYLRRQPPAYIDPCEPAYRSVYPAKKTILIIGVALWVIGMAVFISVFLTCLAWDCGAAGGVFIPLSIILMIVGYILFHCGWASHLVGQPLNTTIVSVEETRQYTAGEKAAEAKFETADDAPPPQVGYWQFTEKAAWQSVASRDTLQ